MIAGRVWGQEAVIRKGGQLVPLLEGGGAGRGVKKREKL